jgi:hypothetical protein
MRRSEGGNQAALIRLSNNSIVRNEILGRVLHCVRGGVTRQLQACRVDNGRGSPQVFLHLSCWSAPSVPAPATSGRVKGQRGTPYHAHLEGTMTQLQRPLRIAADQPHEPRGFRCRGQR